MQTDDFRIQTEAFVGPLDLLLQLIEKRKLLVNDISLATVTDDFIVYVKKLERYPLAQITHFVYTAATLLLIKSKSLLPTLQLSMEEEGDVENLEYRLKVYKYFKKLSLKINDRFGKNILFFRLYVRGADPLFTPPQTLTIAAVHTDIQNVIRNLPKKAFISEATVKKVVNLEDMITRLRDRVQRSLNMSFREFAGVGKKERVHIIVSFLALLELVKQEIIEVQQENHFEDIRMENQTLSTPQYDN